MPQSRPTANPRYQEEEKKDKKKKKKKKKFFLFLFSAYKNVKSFYTGKITKKKKKKKKMLFVYGMYARLFYCLWHMRNQFTVHSELQPYLIGPNHS